MVDTVKRGESFSDAGLVCDFAPTSSQIGEAFCGRSELIFVAPCDGNAGTM
jgi:hypothetical protein